MLGSSIKDKILADFYLKLEQGSADPGLRSYVRWAMKRRVRGIGRAGGRGDARKYCQVCFWEFGPGGEGAEVVEERDGKKGGLGKGRVRYVRVFFGGWG